MLLVLYLKIPNLTPDITEKSSTIITLLLFAVVAELAYALDSGSSGRKTVRVQVPSTA